MIPGVLITAFGGPRSLDEVGGFIATMTGREPSADVVARAKAKYSRIGGSSPLPDIAEGIAVALEQELRKRGADLPVRLGMRYAAPTIADAVDELDAQGVDTVIALSLSPLESDITTRAYRQAVDEAVGDRPIAVLEASQYHLHRALVGQHARALESALRSVDTAKTLVVFTAHSLPCEEIARDATYVRQLREEADAVASECGFSAGAEDAVLTSLPAVHGAAIGQPWLVAYQSRGMRECAWLEPSLDQVIEAAAAEGFGAVAVAPVGFVTDHMETLYDLDVVARQQAFEAGIGFVRSGMPNDCPGLIETLADAVASVLPEEKGTP